ncbi:hypothetical protein [Kitasatospora sp. McL0602]|uniref:hypothetical protein n=1 Tax=Kitasatospora sp. McL0602 TaxID=3439530 RepID=UPI003F8913FA
MTKPASETPMTPAEGGPCTRTRCASRCACWFAELFVAEWLRLWSTRSAPWAFGGSALAVLAAVARSVVAGHRNFLELLASSQASFGSQGCFVKYGSLAGACTGLACAVLMLAVGSIGAVAIVGEYSSGSARACFAAGPERRALLVAKGAVLVAATVFLGMVVVLLSFVARAGIRGVHHVGTVVWIPAASGLPGMLGASALFAPVCALIGLGVGAVTRKS